jgi:hypothetical protein
MTDVKSPSDILAGQVIDRLIAAGHLRADRREALVSKMGAGNLKAEDWKLEIELAAAKGEAS